MVIGRFLVAVAGGLLALAPMQASAQASANSGRCAAAQCYPLEEAREDMRTLYETLQGEHFDLFARTSQAEYDAQFDRMMQAIDGPVPRARFHLMLQEFLAFGRVGHATTNAPINDVIARVQEGETIIPLSITYRNGAMVTDQWASEGDALPRGSQITRLGDLDVAGFERQVAKILSADTPRLMRAKLELGFPVYLALVFGDVPRLDVGYVSPDGSAGEASIPAIGFGEMFALQEARPVPAPPANASPRSAERLGEDVFYLRPGPFFALDSEKSEDGDAYAIAGFKEFIEGAFLSLEASEATDLLIDLRGNPGGDASFSDLILARIADEPYRQSSRYLVRAGENTLASWADREPEGDGGLGDRLARALQRAEAGSVVPVEVPQIEPRSEGRFDGRVWALIDRYSFSNAAVVAAILQDYGIATLIGEETADLATTYGAVERFTLPHSQAVIEYPKAYMVRPSGDESIRGVAPDIAVAPRAIGEASDTVLQSAVAAIKAAR